MNKFIHALVLAVFALGCTVSWGILNLAAKSSPAPLRNLPGFTVLCISLQPVLIVLPILAAFYCLWIWFRKADRVPSWIGFFAAAMGALVLVVLPSMLAAYLPLLGRLNVLTGK